MKITRLWISKYKNIEDVTLEFDPDQLITLLIGQNGLGKSNLIEILALIFRDLFLLDNEADFQSWPYHANQFEYEIEFICKSKIIRIRCKKNIFEIWYKPLGTLKEMIKIKFQEFQNRKKEEFLPEYIIGYYSGENKRVKNIIRKYEEFYWRSFKEKNKQQSTSGIEEKFRPLFFAENFHGQLILLTLALYKDDPKLNEKIKLLFERFLKIETISDFEILFNNPDWQFEKIENKNKSINYLISNIQEEVEYPFWNLKGKADQIITHFYNHQIEWKEPIAYEDHDEDPRKNVYEFLEFDEIKFSDFFTQIKDYLPRAINFFDAIEATSFLEVLNRIKIKVKKRGILELIEFDQLSEGEQQLLSVLGLILITGEEDCLFLLDEPDTHLNPQWQRDYIQLLKDFNLNDENSQIFVATHSPLIAQSMEDANTILFRDRYGEVVIDQTNFKEEGWRIDHVLASDLFGLSSTRPPKYDDFYRIRNGIIEKGELDREDKYKLIEFENIFGAFPTGETINEIETMAFLSKIAKKIKEQEERKKK